MKGRSHMITKYASFLVQESWMAPETGELRRVSHRASFEYTPRPGFLYVRSRAISSRCNDNFDEFPAEEIKQGYRTFIGKPVFVNHHNDDHRRARGVIIDAALHEDVLPDGQIDTWAEVLMEVDAIRFPMLAQGILRGEIDKTSMGTDVAYSKCSFCGNKAATPLDYCKHIPKLKGQRIRRTTASGQQEDVLVREICYGLRFFENSILVEEPADPTAFFLGVEAGPGIATTASSNTVTRLSADDSGRMLQKAAKYYWKETNDEVTYQEALEVAFLHGEVDAEAMEDASNKARGIAEKGKVWDAVHRHLWAKGLVTLWTGDPANMPVAASVTAAPRRTPQWDGEPGEDEKTHPRGDAGKFRKKDGAPSSSGGGGSDSGGGSSTPSGKTTGTGTKEDPIRTPDVEAAAKALMEGNYVELEQPKQISTMLDKLAAEVKAVKEAGGDGVVDLCRVTVAKTNLFCVESKGIPRIKMPQLKVKQVPPDSRAAKEITPTERGEYDLQPLFLKKLKEEGLQVETTEELAANLKASQNELNGEKVAGMTDAVLDGETLGDEPIFVSSDDYIVDGHHRWAAYVAADYEDGTAEDMKLPIHRVNMDIIELLASANRFAEEYGVPTMGVAASKQGCGCGGTQRTASKTAISADELRHMSEVVTRTLGHYNAAVTWHLQHRPDATAETIANIIAERDGSAVEKMTGSKGYIRDYDEWWPKMVAATQAMLDEIRGGTTASRSSAYRHLSAKGLVRVADVRTTRDRMMRGDEVIHGDIIHLPGRGSIYVEEVERSGSDILIVGADEMYLTKADALLSVSPAVRVAASRRVAYGETPAPAKVDTLRDEQCPVCGEKDSYSDERCGVCNFVKPPESFMDPNLDKAKEVDLRAEEVGADGEEGVPVPEEDDLQGVDDPDASTFEPPPESPEDADDPDKVVPAEDGAEDEDEEDDVDVEKGEDDDADDESDDDTTPDFLKKKKKKTSGQIAHRSSQKENSMRPVLAALREQQILIEGHQAQIDAIADLAGIDLTRHKEATHRRVASLGEKTADVDNPAQPIPEPTPEAPYTTTQEEIAPINPSAPEGGSLPDDPTTPGATSVTDVSPDATTSVDTVGGTVLDEPLDLNEQDPTRPVEGTTEMRPLDEVKIETDVVAETGDTSTVKFPLTDAFSAQPRTTGSQDRTFASLRLARLRMQANIATGDELALGEAIASSDLTDEAIASEIGTLAQVVQASRSANPDAEQRRRLVPRQANSGNGDVERQTPSFGGGSLPSIEALASSASGITEDEVLFE